ncbi:ATP-binding region, ATPase-like domain protein [Candidatus Magnetobacterium bavaricum]|uniref:histidine kinase n=1 Tax=Candidatus Magnetobacterium bavaricum TaxID=29290 RepID=A0A0F3H0G3_9BACT|nr:ATP-binding region, ATPase-like domain protein [Candidatus Magnetobacterium bavaricum]
MKDLQDNKLTISISDNGGGIDTEIIDKVFDPYFTTKFKTRGKGLGLYMVKTMIDNKMEGTVSVSNIKEGAEFKITMKGGNGY